MIRNIIISLVLFICFGCISVYSVDAVSEFDGYCTVSEAGDALREAMVNRETEVEIKVESESLNYGKIAEDMTEKAMMHTGDPDEGDYLKWHYNGYTYTATRLSKYDTNYYVYDLTISYYTSAEQEDVVTLFLNDLISTLITDEMSSYERVCAVYDYICDNVVYDDSDDDDLVKYTAYGALINGESVCQGYSSLFYTMSLMAGVDTRMVYGVTDAGEGHMWNIVKLGDYYYNVDATWDAELAQSGREYEYFLKSDSGFDGHTRDEKYATEVFYSEYPMAETDYTYQCKHDFELISQKDATCGNDGERIYQCVKCGEETAEKIPATGLSRDDGITTEEQTCTERGGVVEVYTCEVCGKTYTEKIREMGDDAFDGGNCCEKCGETLAEQESVSEAESSGMTMLDQPLMVDEPLNGERILLILYGAIIAGIAFLLFAFVIWRKNAD